MSKLNSIRIQNLRSLIDTGDIELKPLTILVGRNSVGKSTFARTFPLIRQSCEAQKKSPILWYGRLVDFGDFTTAVNKKNIEDGMSFSFNFSLSHKDYLKILLSTPLIPTEKKKYLDNLEEMENTYFESKVTISIVNIEQKDPQYTIDIELLNNKLKLILKPKKQKIYATINNNTYEIDEFYKIEQQQFFPNIEMDLKNIKNSENRLHKYVNFYLKNRNFIFPIIVERKYKDLTNKTDINKIVELIEKNIFTEVNSDEFEDLGLSENEISELKEIYFISKTESILDFYNKAITSYFTQVKYLEPLRATAQRYYRKQELAIDEVDSKGSNIAMFLQENHKHEKLKELIDKHFNLEFSTESSSGHISLHLIINKETQETINLADLGVGYSQILPVILQLWSAVYTNKNDSGCLVVEQPELHLHPAYQAKISDITVDIINQLKDLERTYNFIYETHSPHLINRLGELIEEGFLDHNDVQILIFDNENSKTNIIHSKFNDEGILENWPFGFFN